MNWEHACRHLKESDKELAPLIERYAHERLDAKGDPFLTLVRAIVGQQISVKAADSIFARVESAVGTWSPERLLAVEVPVLRSCGLSERKVTYLRGIAAAFQDGTLRPEAWETMDDEAILKQLVQLKGIGRWTAEMFLMFHLQRPDVLPVDDVGLLRACSLIFGWDRDFDLQLLHDRAQKWSPYRSVAVWHLWRALDPIPVAY